MLEKEMVLSDVLVPYSLTVSVPPPELATTLIGYGVSLTNLKSLLPQYTAASCEIGVYEIWN